MMAHHRDADAAGDFPEKEMVGKAAQVNPATISRLEMKPLWDGGRLVDE